jgi:hypothetical protein
MHSWNIFGARMSHKQIRIHKTHHGLDSGEATTFPLIAYHVVGHKTSIQMSFDPMNPKWESWNFHSWDSYNFGPP